MTSRSRLRRAALGGALLALLAPLMAVSSGATATAEQAPPARTNAQQALDTAYRLLEGGGTSFRRGTSVPSDVASFALADLARAMDDLSGPDLELAHLLLARPEDGADDPVGFGYLVPDVKRCNKTVCVHWVTSTTDAPPSDDWVNQSLKTYTRVYKKETKGLGFRKPLPDGKRGGNKKFDFYLKELGPNGLRGYCVSDPKVRVQQFQAASYCVMDNNFAEFGTSPVSTQLATAASEFFHAIQNSYDAGEDRWVVGSTAAWVEERVADNVNLNRAYLDQSIITEPNVPLDSYQQGANYHLGNWAFFEYLTTRYGRGFVKQLWAKRLAADRLPDNYSMEGVVSLLRKRGGMTKVFAAFAAANTAPQRFYPEGGSWPKSPTTPYELSKSAPSTGTVSVRLDHLTSTSAQLRPDAGVTKRKQRVRIRIKGLNGRKGGAAQLLIYRKKGGLQRQFVPLNRKGRASVRIPFSTKTVNSVTLTVVNASTRYRCYRNQVWSCQGKPRDDNVRYTYSASLR